MPVELTLANGRKYPQTGKLGAIEPSFRNETASIAFRADFRNPDRLLCHGQTGKVSMHRTFDKAIVIPQRATFELLDKQYVYVVGKDDVAHQREITVEHEVDETFVIKKGLDENDRIVLDGVQRVRDGQKLEYEFRKPEEAVGSPKSGREK